ncbi:MAG: 30S ribosomal protein S17 [Candidatus Diapherotrites archaeon]|uniref:30S ribosomal protein S17 n=1 Tax=Candidatus Iainarchaeum sp. TaxID=3101447 RepID=A0A7K4BYC4_9ARCH|nr:30S ribosomal protein S17 [Candidatus Diapherotrites archaeon]
MVEKKEKKTKETKIKDTKIENTKVETKKTSEGKEKTYPIRGNIFEGKVTSAKANKTVTVERIISQYAPKYERYRKIKSKIKAHNPTSINAKEGDIVKIGETRKISKTKNFIVMEIIKK